MIGCLHKETDYLLTDLEIAKVRIFSSLPQAAQLFLLASSQGGMAAAQSASPRTCGPRCIYLKSLFSVSRAPVLNLRPVKLVYVKGET